MKKDDPFDRLVGRAARPQDLARPAGDCLDAETLAAWADGSLTELERTAAETHTADCERCLAMVSAVAKTAPPPVEAQGLPWFSLRWLVPITTAVVVVGVWVLVQTRPGDSRQVALNPSPPIDAIAPAPATAPPPQLERHAAAQAEPPADAKAKQAQPIQAARTRQAAEAARRDEAFEKRELQKRLKSDGLVAQGQTAAAATPQTPVAPPNVPTLPAGAPSPTVVTSGIESQRKAASTPAPFASAAARRGGGAGLGMRAPLVIQSPDPSMRWRVAAPPANVTIDGVAVSRLERSTDGGRTWTPQQTGIVGEMLLAGASPAPNVCWVVGQAGVVLLTTDGTTWRRIEFSEPRVDLVAVTARDALSATVTTADGRTYVTDDGGKTWRLQENPPAAF